MNNSQYEFVEAEKGYVNYYQEGETPEKRAVINYGELNVEGNQMVIMDHGMGGAFTFNEAFSLMISCKDQAEIDYFWDKLSVVPESEQCGWVKDQFGLSWQIVPANMDKIMAGATEEGRKRGMAALLNMKKLDIAALEKAVAEE
ncbi:VOC family protein [Hespellia stercorisuis]|uniref:Glyoxalase superfamily enzyme, possibly 3-demethylubiquinone-9 3-methyltransferase n=1 Tax=Hespellia stercorisuis DSM 15480 TaxID=1121950 RepID=A0A1M6I7L2_9FIRM|nr:VOC family protein [Hespellia stercorisuis]SHJ30464.1 Glyoxalase superfamily enzyme, possibly 3-demethylubiquinone-9 3-methyltransferase [Hespellia stercorisuis DSM 15480]